MKEKKVSIIISVFVPNNLTTLICYCHEIRIYIEKISIVI